MHYCPYLNLFASIAEGNQPVADNAGLDQLTQESHIKSRRIGKPAPTERDVVDSSYSYAIVLQFEDLAGHDAYQASSEHEIFLDTCFDMISRVQVYDIEVPGQD